MYPFVLHILLFLLLNSLYEHISIAVQINIFNNYKTYLNVAHRLFHFFNEICRHSNQFTQNSSQTTRLFANILFKIIIVIFTTKKCWIINHRKIIVNFVTSILFHSFNSYENSTTNVTHWNWPLSAKLNAQKYCTQ